MAETKLNVIINNITKENEGYRCNITLTSDGTTIDYVFSSIQLGFNLKEAIEVLGGGALPESLAPLNGYIKMVNSLPALAEITVTSLSKVRNAISSQGGATREGSALLSSSKYMLKYDVMPKFTAADCYIKGKITRVIDGDTVVIHVYEVGEDFKKVNDVKEGDNATIRLVGINTPEVSHAEKGDMRSSNKNRTWLSKYGIKPTDENLEKAYKVGLEGKAFIEQFLGLSLVVDPDTGSANNGRDAYNRILGVGYIMVSQNATNLGFDAVHLNGSLIANYTSVEFGTTEKITLALPYYDVAIQGDGSVASKFDLQSWWKYVPNYEQKKKELEAAKNIDSRSMKEKLEERFGIVVNDDGSVAVNSKDVIRVGTVDYIVNVGEDVNDIIRKYPNTSVKDLYEKNNINYTGIDYIDRYSISPGMHLKVPVYEVFENNVDALFVDNKLYNLNLVPADSETEDYMNPKVDNRDLLDGIVRPNTYDKDGNLSPGKNPYGNHYLRIGDCTLNVPPLSIRVDTISSNQRIPALRSKSSIQIGSGYSNTTVTLDLFFSNESAVNGYMFPNPVSNEEPYYRNGLRPLIAQFKKAPFLPIENELINDRFKIFSVALKDLQVSSVPGFPGVMQARLTLYEFDHTPYMPHEEWFEGTFCWPLFRWYYQRCMQPKQPEERTYLGKLDTLNDDIVFRIPDESFLIQRKQAIYEMNRKMAPSIFEEANSRPNSVAYQIAHDKDKVEIGSRQWELFKQVIKRYPQKDYPLLYNEQGVFAPDNGYTTGAAGDWERYPEQSIISRLKVWYPDRIDSRHARTKYADALMDILRYTYNDFKDEVVFVFNFMQPALNFLEEHWILNEAKVNDVVNTYGLDPALILHKEGRAEISMVEIGDGRYLKFAATTASDIGYPVYVSESGGVIYLYLQAEINQRKTNPALKISEGKLTVYGIEPHDTILLNLIMSSADATALSYIDYKKEFEKVNALANTTEADIPTEVFPLPDIYISEISASLHNNYAPLQLNGTEFPTYQFLGGSDIAVELAIRTKSRKAVEGFKELMSTIQRLSREYNIALTSGVLTIENNLFSLFGVKSVLIEKLSVETSGEDKESFVIRMSLIAFDKTQRLKEEFTHANIAQTFDDDKMEEDFYKYSETRRNKDGFEYAIIDYSLRQLEVYPDLELPTYKEVNEALPYLKIVDAHGMPYRHYPNPDNAKFVDPDFYIRTEVTMKEFVHAVLTDEKNNVGMYYKDAAGFEEVEVAPTPAQQREGNMAGPAIALSDETLEWIKNNIDEVYVGDNQKPRIATNGAAGTIKTVKDTEAKNPMRAVSSSWKGAASDNEKARMTKENVFAPLTAGEVIRWGKASTEEDAQAIIDNLRNPTPEEFVTYLSLCVKAYWKNVPSDKELIESGKEDIPTYTYGETRVSAPSITKEKVINVLKALYDLENGWKHFSSDGKTPFWSATDDIGIAQLNIYTSGIIQNLDQARRLAYFWMDNLEEGVKFFAQNYNFAMDNADVYNKDAGRNPLDWAICCYNKGPVSGLKNYSNPQEVDYYNSVIDRLRSKYGSSKLTAATPTSLFDASLGKKQDEAKAEMERIRKILEHARTYKPTTTADTYKGYSVNPIDPSEFEIDDAHAKYYKMVTSLSTGKNVLVIDLYGEIDISRKMAEDAKTDQQKQLEKQYASKAGSAIAGAGPANGVDGRQVAMLYRTQDTPIQKALMDVIDGMLETHTLHPEQEYIRIVKGSAQRLGVKPKVTHNPGEGIYIEIGNSESIYAYEAFELRDVDKNAQEDVANIEKNMAIDAAKVGPDDMGVLYRSSFDDMLEYDHRGRLLRAFPTYQMFIIDEGEWMLWHKLWDNFYGYNSIVSIDLIKDRRIVADTALIEMTNIYHNLTGYDTDTSYGEWDLTLGNLLSFGSEEQRKVWNTMWNIPDKGVLQARRDQVTSMMLKPGARINLRMGYGANAYRLPVVFNGTLAEMNTGEIVTILAQGDGVELTNKLRVKPGQNTDPGPFQGTKEPRSYICEMLTSKGSWFKNILAQNDTINALFFRGHPLGIMHFGVPQIPPTTLLKPTTFFDAFRDFGEVGVNIYSAAGYETMSQWVYTEGVKKGEEIAKKWTLGGLNPQGGDEPNVKLSLFDKTPWDVLQAYAHACPDYITTVVPFEYRSTIFFGKPWWGVLDRYEYKYTYDSATDIFKREPYKARRRTLSQMRMYTSQFDIIANNIVATEQFMYTNVIGRYNKEGGEKVTQLIQADYDINPNKQTTAIVDLPIEASGWGTNFWTQEKYAEVAATSALRDYMKDMYQGELIVLGDPTVKPYDKMSITDSKNDMTGMAEIKRVVHHFSADTGFITEITPDCISIIDDLKGVSIVNWGAAALFNIVPTALGMWSRNIMWRTLWKSPIGAGIKSAGIASTDALLNTALAHMVGASKGERVVFEVVGNRITEFIKGVGEKKIAGAAVTKDEIEKGLNKVLEAAQKDFAQAAKDAAKTGKAVDNFDLIRAYNNIFDAFDELEQGKELRALGKITDGRLFGKNSKTLTGLADTIDKLSDVIKTKKEVEAIDKLWEASKFLNEPLWKNPGLFGKVGNLGWKGVSKVSKLATQLAAKTGAATIRNTALAAAKLSGHTVLKATVVGAVVDLGLTILTETLVEKYTRFLKARQALIIIPLKYRGMPFTAGINGHKGLIAGEVPSVWDKMLAGQGWGGATISGLYAWFGVDAPEYEVSVGEATSKTLGG